MPPLQEILWCNQMRPPVNQDIQCGSGHHHPPLGDDGTAVDADTEVIVQGLLVYFYANNKLVTSTQPYRL